MCIYGCGNSELTARYSRITQCEVWFGPVPH